MLSTELRCRHRNSHEGPATGGALAVCAIRPSDHAKLLVADTAQTSDTAITMGCGDTYPVFPGKRYEDWQLDDPAGRGLDAVRPIRDDIEDRARGLIAELT